MLIYAVLNLFYPQTAIWAEHNPLVLPRYFFLSRAIRQNRVIFWGKKKKRDEEQTFWYGLRILVSFYFGGFLCQWPSEEGIKTMEGCKGRKLDKIRKGHENEYENPNFKYIETVWCLIGTFKQEITVWTHLCTPRDHIAPVDLSHVTPLQLVDLSSSCSPLGSGGEESRGSCHAAQVQLAPTSCQPVDILRLQWGILTSCTWLFYLWIKLFSVW